MSNVTVAVGYLLRGATDDWKFSAERFLESYECYQSGLPHTPWVILKGFPDDLSLKKAEEMFESQGFQILHVDDDAYDIGAYVDWASAVNSDYLVFLNTHSEILGDLWLKKMIRNLEENNFSLVAATGSYETLRHLSPAFPEFPNVHLRSNAFALKKELFMQCTKELCIRTKHDAFSFESGEKSLTRQVMKLGGNVGIVGKNGRAYRPENWPFSDTFRQNTQSNLLIGDNVTRSFDKAVWIDKRKQSANTWGDFKQVDRTRYQRWRFAFVS